MNILSIKDLGKIGREDFLFKNVTFGLNEGEKAALIGRNGSGKSTLLSTIAGIYQPDEGSIVINKEAGISFLAQNPSFLPEDSINDHIFKSSSPKLNVIKDFLEALEKYSLDPNLKNQKKFDELNQKMENQDLWNYESQVSSILSTLGINDRNQKMGTLSGGMVKKVALAQVLVEDTKLLLLDEPTNHLDIKTICFLEKYLRDTDRTVLMVTHDRYFLDSVCTNIFELSRKRIKLYQGNYSDYLDKKEIEAEIEENTERRIESVLRFERDWLRRGPCARGTKAKARIQRDMSLINREKFAKDKDFTFEVQGRRLGGKVLVLDNISKNYKKANGNPVLKEFSYTFTKGQRIGIFGDNGSGKSTFLNIITGKLQSDTGSVTKGENTSFGYYTQNPYFKDKSMTVLEYLKEAGDVVKRKDGKILSAGLFLNEFGFEGKIQVSPLSSLSGGELKRLFLIRLLMENPNFLVLDEPTNDFDIFTMNILEQFLMNYEGCLLIVSHDRYFMDKIADSLFILEEDGSISGWVGKCSEYIQYRDEKAREELLNERKEASEKKKNQENKGEKADSPASTGSETLSETASSPKQKKKLSYNEQKEFEKLEKDIAQLEEEKNILEEKMQGNGKQDFSDLQSVSKKYVEISSLLDEKYQRWEELASFI